MESEYIQLIEICRPSEFCAMTVGWDWYMVFTFVRRGANKILNNLLNYHVAFMILNEIISEQD